MIERTDRRLRLLFLLAVFVLFSSTAVVRLSYWQLAEGPRLRQVAAGQQTEPAADQPLRGEIRDRNGTVLARTAYLDLLAAFPDRLDPLQEEHVGTVLGQILELDDSAALALRETLAGDDPYVILARSLSPDQSEQIRAAMALPDEEGGLSGLALEPRAVRTYPNPGGAPGTSLASQLLGFVSADGEGQYGIEGYYDRTLAAPSSQVASADGLAVLPPGPADATRTGTDVTLTIDASLQLQLEKELYAAWVADRATRVSAVILDPDSGAVLAWASVPGYDANDYGSVAADRPELLVDPIASSVYEPGSVMKMLTASAALEAGTVTLDEEVQDSYALRFGRTLIHNSDRGSNGRMPFRDAIAFSRNVATARVAIAMDPTVDGAAATLYATWRRFGLGERSGIDLASEAEGLVSDPARRPWQPLDLANRSFGQGVAVTQIQLAVAFAAMANGGLRVTPHLVQREAGAESAAAPGRVVEEGLASQLRTLLEYVTQRVPWYRDGTQIPGYVVGGKTGTAQIWNAEEGRWWDDRYNFSFAGFVGAQYPEAIIVTRVEEAMPVQRGGYLDLGIESYELFRRLAVHTVTALDVAPLPAPLIPPPGPDRPEHTGRDPGA